MKKIYFLLLMVLGVSGVWGQVTNGTLDFGTVANGTAATTANTGFGGVRTGSGGGGFTLQNPGQAIGADAELRGIAPTAASINSVGITSTEYGTSSTTFTISFELNLSGGSSGNWYFFAGNGSSFAAAQSSSFTGAQVFTGIQWVFGSSNTVTTNNRAAGAWAAMSGTPFAQNTSYFVTIVGNNSTSTVNYGVSQSIAANTYDLWINGILVGDDLSKAQLPASTAINAFRFYSENSTGNVATIALDNIRWYNTAVLPATHLIFNGVPATGTTGTNLSSFTVEAHSGSTSGPLANQYTGAITLSKASGTGNISGTLAPAAVAGVATYNNIQFDAASTYKIDATAASPLIKTTSGDIVISPAAGLTPPTLIPAVGATVDADFNITYTDDAAWRGAVTTVKYGATTLTVGTDYSLVPGVLTLKPTGGNPALHVAGTQTVSVTATGYNDATVSQAIGFGAATQLGIITQPGAPATNGGLLNPQPSVAVQDQYGNTVTSSSTSITAAVGAGVWTIGGTTPVNAVAGLATFTDLTATSAASVSATIDFTSTGLTHKESNNFTIPNPPTTYTYIGTGTGSWANSANWSPTGVPTNQDAVLFNGSSAVIVTNVPAAMLKSFSITGSGAVTLQASGASTLNIGGGTVPELNIASGSSLILDGSSAITINVLTGNTGSITGSVTVQGGAHRLTAADANGITFGNGSIFTGGTGFTGAAFGTTILNSIVFANGSAYIQQAGSSPFSAAQPASIVIFQTGSLYKIQGNLTPSLSGRTYGNLELDFAAATITTTASAAVNIDNLTITQGSLNFGATGIFNIKGNISVASGATLVLAPATAGTLTLNGTTAQSVNNAGTLTFGTNESITINNSNGVTLNTDVVLGSAATLTLTSGSITLGNSNLTVSAISGGSAANYIKTSGTGGFTLTNIGATPTIFPVGTGTDYTPATITNNGTADNFTVNVAAATPCNADPLQSVNRVWTISEATAGGSLADITMQWNSADENVAFIRALCEAVHCTGGVIDMQSPKSIAGGSDPYTQTISGVSSFSPFGVTSALIALPISIEYLQGSKQGINHNLAWKVNCTNAPSVAITLERSNNGHDFTPIYNITATALQCQQAFAYTDANPLAGVNYYRLRITDASGKYSYSSIVALLNAVKGLEIVNISPNPITGGQFKLNVTSAEQTKMDVVITDMQGRVVSRESVNVTSGFNAINMNIGKLAPGIYQLQGNTAEGKTRTLNLVKQ